MLMLLAVLAGRELRNWRSAPYLLLACIGVASFFATMTPDALGLSPPARTVFGYLGAPHLVFVWLFALSLFEHDFTLARWHILVGVIYSAPLFWVSHFGMNVVAVSSPWLLHAVTFASLALMGHLAYFTLHGRTNDLLEKRRAARIHFVLAVTFVAVITALVDPLTADYAVTVRRMIKAVAIWPAIVWACYWLLAIDHDAINFRPRHEPEPVPNERDAEMIRKLNIMMTEQEVFREAELTIVALASRLAVTQHRLRSLINTTLGYQNFSEYLNDYRVNAATQMFSDPVNRHVPILTIAMDCGFKSLSPFNKAFRTSQEMTPSEYRKRISCG